MEDNIYDYDYMLDKLYDNLEQKKENKESIKIKTPSIQTSSKKTLWLNFNDISKSIDRDINHFMSFITTEFGCSGSINSTGTLILNGKYKQQSIEGIIKKYIKLYVICPSCKSMKTKFNKEDRITFLVCSSCHSQSNIQTIQTGFTATTRADRVQNRKKE